MSALLKLVGLFVKHLVAVTIVVISQLETLYGYIVIVKDAELTARLIES